MKYRRGPSLPWPARRREAADPVEAGAGQQKKGGRRYCIGERGTHRKNDCSGEGKEGKREDPELLRKCARDEWGDTVGARGGKKKRVNLSEPTGFAKIGQLTRGEKGKRLSWCRRGKKGDHLTLWKVNASYKKEEKGGGV